ncbi:hypothetical protein EHV15_34540 [Paenibacillus oralis]|uniref:Uncharacterized protein n=1 Tax=Paenibacillus oralis TaxID=2490856 RepID=A0A3P3TC87_9BACL|nr:hypothetical protein [Paenibacillus oralis]RRJ54718.1 hypothetical protein EHV15_34540 [Paenibacillus oralis]
MQRSAGREGRIIVSLKYLKTRFIIFLTTFVFIGILFSLQGYLDNQRGSIFLGKYIPTSKNDPLIFYDTKVLRASGIHNAQKIFAQKVFENKIKIVIVDEVGQKVDEESIHPGDKVTSKLIVDDTRKVIGIKFILMN